MIEIKEVISRSKVKEIVALAEIILPDYYETIIPPKYMTFFISTMQSEETILEQIEKKHFKYYLLHYENNLAGYMGIQINVKEIIISKLYILKIFRGKNIGKFSLILSTISRQLNIPAIQLILHNKNTLAINFYLSHGYLIKENLSHSFENGLSLEGYKMQKCFRHMVE